MVSLKTMVDCGCVVEWKKARVALFRNSKERVLGRLIVTDSDAVPHQGEDKIGIYEGHVECVMVPVNAWNGIPWYVARLFSKPEQWVIHEQEAQQLVVALILMKSQGVTEKDETNHPRYEKHSRGKKRGPGKKGTRFVS